MYFQHTLNSVHHNKTSASSKLADTIVPPQTLKTAAVLSVVLLLTSSVVFLRAQIGWRRSISQFCRRWEISSCSVLKRNEGHPGCSSSAWTFCQLHARV